MVCWQTRKVYIAQNGARFPECGNGYRNALVFLWLLSVIAIVIRFVILTGGGGGGGGGGICECCWYTYCPGDDYDNCHYDNGRYYQCCSDYQACERFQLSAAKFANATMKMASGTSKP